jgi:branched-chain amino acid transport system substrate-binding protein
MSSSRAGRMRGLLSLAALMAVAAVVAACGSSGSSSSSGGGAPSTGTSTTGKPFRMLMVIDTSGPTKLYGSQELLAMKASAAYWNDHGGIGGRRIVVDSVDDNGDPTTAVTELTNWVLQNGKPDVVFPGTTGGDYTGLPPAIKRMGLFSVGFDFANICTSGAQTKCPNYFAPAGQTKWQSVATAAFFKKQGYKKVGLLVEQDAFSESEVPPLLAALKADGIQYSQATFSPSAVDVTPEVSELNGDHPDAMWVAALSGGFGYALKARQGLGLTNSLPVVMDFSAGGFDLTQVASGTLLDNSWESSQRPADPSLKIPGRTLLLKAAKPFGQLSPVYLAGFEWDTLLAVHDAAEQAGSTDTASLTKALNSLDSKYVHDPLWMENPAVQFTPDVHDNALNTTASSVFVRSGPLVNGMIQSK